MNLGMVQKNHVQFDEAFCFLRSVVVDLLNAQPRCVEADSMPIPQSATDTSLVSLPHN